MPSGVNGFSLRCGGTIIDKSYVLTAAHCFFAGENNPTIVRLGDLDITSISDGEIHEDVAILRTIVHPG